MHLFDRTDYIEESQDRRLPDQGVKVLSALFTDIDLITRYVLVVHCLKEEKKSVFLTFSGLDLQVSCNPSSGEIAGA